ncbi:hypothetical protein [Chloroflexus sp.]|uniref:hypothetical protein n=1 Tax=Chloroflexus sp. TaxID=1904827 RepID=UPI002634D1FA|nr:hypothetical protein [uncultured Chloroflexus sp.]
MLANPSTTHAQSYRWAYRLVYGLLLIIFFLPLYTEKPYLPQEQGQVINALLQVTPAEPYRALAPFFHLATIALMALMVWRPERAGRLVAAYMGLNYLVIGWVQGQGLTVDYGYVVHTGNVVACVLLAMIWLRVAWQNQLNITLSQLNWRHYALAPLALLAFWSPAAVTASGVMPDFNPMLLLTSPAYGLTYCLTTPVFLFWLIIALPNVPSLAYRITAFNGLLYGLINQAAWFDPAGWWMGFLHLPLLGLSIIALWLARRQLPVTREG